MERRFVVLGVATFGFWALVLWAMLPEKPPPAPPPPAAGCDDAKFAAAVDLFIASRDGEQVTPTDLWSKTIEEERALLLEWESRCRHSGRPLVVLDAR